jgi:phosphoribosyl-AMP cyclohydrolase
MSDPAWFEELRWNGDGLIPAIVQDNETGAVLMMAWMDRHALRETLTTGQGHYYSRSRREHWHKGATSGHVQNVREIRVDCDADVLLVRVDQVGGACHEGYFSCFSRQVTLDRGFERLAERLFEPDAVYGATKHSLVCNK